MIIEKFTPCAKLHNQIQVVLVVISFKVLHNVGMVNFFEQIDLIHHVLQIIARHLAFVQNFHRYLKFRVFAVSALVDFSESSFAKYMSIDIILQFKLVNASMHRDLRGLLPLSHLEMVLFMATQDKHLSLFFILL